MTTVKQKWRPALWMVVFGALTLVALLPLISLGIVIGIEKLIDTQFRLRSIGGFLTLAAGNLIMAGVIGAIFLRTLLRPIQELIVRTNDVGTGADDAFRPLSHIGTRCSPSAFMRQRFDFS